MVALPFWAQPPAELKNASRDTYSVFASQAFPAKDFPVVRSE